MVQHQVELIAGARVAAAVTQPGGFSPGVAARLLLTNGGRVFVKAVSPNQNPDTPTLHRREAVVAAALPLGAPVPKLLGSFDDGHWVALVFQDVDGRHPATPWARRDLDAVMAALDQLAERLTPCPIDVPPAVEEFAEDFQGWDRIAAGRPLDLDPWVAGNLDSLRGLAARGVAVGCYGLGGNPSVAPRAAVKAITCSAVGSPFTAGSTLRSMSRIIIGFELRVRM